MSTVEEAISARRSVRRFRPDPVPEEMVLKLLEAARLAPSAGNRQPWRLAVVTDAAQRSRLAEVSGYLFAGYAPLIIVCACDLRAYSLPEAERRHQELADAGVIAQLTEGDPRPRKPSRLLSLNPEQMLRNAMANTFIAIEHMVLMAQELGLGTCWVGAIEESEEVRAMFGLPASMQVVAMLAVGYPAEEPKARPRLSLEKITLPAPAKG